MNQEKEKSFFRKIIISIKDFEKYPELASKKWGIVISYLLKLLAIFTIIVSFTITYKITVELQKGLEYIKNDIPEFAFENGKLNFQTNSPIILENMDNLLDTIIIDTLDINNEKINAYKENLQKSSNGIVIMEDRILLKTRSNKWNYRIFIFFYCKCVSNTKL